MLKTSLTTILAVTLMTGSLALAEDQDDSSGNNTALPKENREFNIGMPPAAAAEKKKLPKQNMEFNIGMPPAIADESNTGSTEAKKKKKKTPDNFSFGVEREMKESGEK